MCVCFLASFITAATIVPYVTLLPSLPPSNQSVLFLFILPFDVHAVFKQDACARRGRMMGEKCRKRLDGAGLCAVQCLVCVCVCVCVEVCKVSLKESGGDNCRPLYTFFVFIGSRSCDVSFPVFCTTVYTTMEELYSILY